jgi:translation initiation factor 1 (eIF-1/SUI1)
MTDPSTETSTEQQTEASTEGSTPQANEQQAINIDARKLFNLGANLLVAGFKNQSPENAKKLFKELKQGVSVNSGELSGETSGVKIPIRLELDRSEYKGQFNYPNFELSLNAMLQKFQTEVRKDKDLKELRTLTNESTGGIVFNLPSGVEIQGNLNVMMLCMEPSADCLAVRLIYVDSAQFREQS